MTRINQTIRRQWISWIVKQHLMIKKRLSFLLCWSKLSSLFFDWLTNWQDSFPTSNYLVPQQILGGEEFSDGTKRSFPWILFSCQVLENKVFHQKKSLKWSLDSCSVKLWKRKLKHRKRVFCHGKDFRISTPFLFFFPFYLWRREIQSEIWSWLH